MHLRPESPADVDAVRGLMDAAFGQPQEGQIVDRLREADALTLALVAEVDGTVRGSIFFSPVTADESATRLVGLAPMAVFPSSQRQGLGGALVEAGLRQLQDGGYDGVVVLGHPDYYPRFGFKPASRFGLSCIYPVPDEVFMARALRPGGLDAYAGVIRYHQAFG